jgi:hypothetical protein
MSFWQYEQWNKATCALERFCAFVIAVPVAVLRRLFFIVVFIVVIDDWFWFPFFISLF